MKPQSSSNMGHVGSKTRSVGQIIEKPCEHSRGNSFCPIFIKLAQNDHLDNISVIVLIWVMSGSKTRSVGQMIEKSCEHNTGHVMHPIVMKICQNGCFDEIWVRFEYESCWVKN